MKSKCPCDEDEINKQELSIIRMLCMKFKYDNENM